MKSDNKEVVIQIDDLRTQFGSNVIHDHLDLEVYRGEVIGVVGGSGTGKSVLLKSIIGLIKPSAGNIKVFGEDIHRASPKTQRALQQAWGVLFQDGALFSSLTVGQNVQLPLREHLKLSNRLLKEIACIKIKMVGLPLDSGIKYPSELSGGMRKRAGLARALALDPEIVFLDEPTSGLDPIGAAAIDDLIKELTESLGLTVFMVTHDLDSLYTICDRIAVIDEQRIIVVDTLATVLTFDHPWVQAYFHGPRARE